MARDLHRNSSLDGSRMPCSPRAWLILFVAVAAAIVGTNSPADAIGRLAQTATSNPLLSAPDDPARELSLLLRKLDQSERLLYVTAHPDDEDAGLLTLLTHRRGVEAGLLTVTRGEGGQNEIGTELFDALGVLRSRELQAAARFTGVQQFHTRAFEFGYSFSVEETYEKWHRESILRDIVRVYRSFRPDVILTMHPEGDGGGQHHQATARMAYDAIEITASDRWPELGSPHRVRRLFHQLSSDETGENLTEISLDSYDPLLGESYISYDYASRGEHKCQGMARRSDSIPSRISRWNMRFGEGESLRSLTGLFEGLEIPLVDDSFAGTTFTSSWQAGVEKVRSDHRVEEPEKILAPLLALWDLLGAERDRVRRSGDLSAWVRFQTLEVRTAKAVELALGLRLRVRALNRYVGPGESFQLQVAVSNPSSRAISVRHAPAGKIVTRMSGLDPANPGGEIAPGWTSTLDLRIETSPDAQPTIARSVPRHGSEIDDATAARFLEPDWSAVQIETELTVEGRVLPLPATPAFSQEQDASFPRIFYADPELVPDPSIRSPEPVLAVPVSGDSKTDVEVTFLVSSLRGGDVIVEPVLPEGWTALPTEQVVATRKGGAEQPISFTLHLESEPTPGDHPLSARVRYASGSHSNRPDTGYRRIEYPHIHPGTLLCSSKVDLRLFPCQTAPNVRLGYIEGSGDKVLDALDRLGVTPSLLTAEDLLDGDLSEFDVIMTGVRAYKVRDDLKNAQARLMAWVENGGTLLVQYNKFEFNAGEETSSPYAPYPGTLVGRGRVTVEESPVVLNDSNHALLRFPNELGHEDWANWVQERGLYFLEMKDDRYTDIFTLEDPWPYNAGPKGGALVHTRYGEGHWVYIGVGLFRQLPAGVPGAYRLLSNLLALGAASAN